MNRRAVTRVVLVVMTAVLSLRAWPLWAQGATQTATATEVRVTRSQGITTGTLVSLTGTEVVFRQKNRTEDTRYPLAVVERIETVHRNARNLAIAGGAVGLLVALSSDLCGSGRPYGAAGATGEPDCITAKPLLITGGMAALGFAIGRAVDNERRRVLYPAPALPAVRVAPHAGRRGAGVRVTFTW